MISNALKNPIMDKFSEITQERGQTGVVLNPEHWQPPTPGSLGGVLLLHK